MPEPVFTLTGLPDDDDDSPLLLGLWTAAAAPVSFSTPPAHDEPETLLWRVHLPDDGPVGERWLAQGEKRLQESRIKLDQLGPRLDRLAALQPALEAVSFSAAAPSLPTAEAELLYELSRAEDGSAPIAFAIKEDVMGQLRQLQQAVRYYVAAETVHQEMVLGRTTLSWVGHTDTVWAARSTARQVNLHRRTVRLAAGSKDAMVRLLFLTTQMAAKIALSLSTGGLTAAAAIPIAWRYIRNVLTELEKLDAMQQL